MSRDYRNMKVFTVGDALALRTYVLTRKLPTEERYGLSSQIRRSAVSVPTNIVEGSTRGEREFLRYINIAFGSANETRYLLSIIRRCLDLNVDTHSECETLESEYDLLLRMLGALVRTIETDLGLGLEARG
jgi:four helix bundle protein